MSGNPLPPSPAFRPWPVVLAFTVVMLLGAIPLGLFAYYDLQWQQKAARDIAAERAFQLRERLDDALSATRALAASVHLHDGKIDHFDELAAEMLPLYPGTHAFGAAPDGIVRSMVPLAGNEKAIGHDLFKDPKRAAEAKLARDTRQLVVAGPFVLRQGGVGVVGRNPVFLTRADGSDAFWGFTIVLVRLSDLLNQSHLTQLENAGYRYSLWRTHPDTGLPDVFARSAGAEPEDPVHHEIEVPQGHWFLSVAPAAGWHNRATLAAGAALLFLLALAAAIATHHRLGQRALLLAEQSARRESDERLRSLVANLPGAAYRCALDKEWTVEYISDGILDLCGYPAGDFISQSRSYASVIHPDDTTLVDRAVRGALARREPFSMEYRIIHADGDIRWVHEKGHAVYGPGDKLLYLEGLFLDITARHRASDALQELNATLEQRIATRTTELLTLKEAAETANRAKSAFLANMSHELRTPLNAILGFTQLMVREGRLPSDQRRHLDTINRSGQHLLALINDILEISRIEAGRVVVNKQNLDLHELLDSLIDMSALRARGKGLALRLERAPAVPRHVETDGAKLRQVLINLLTNAIKFTSRGEIVLAVNAATTGPQVVLHFSVKDSGSGMTPEEVSRLFQAFYQTASGASQNEGSGLGLAISRQFVEMLGGELQVVSTPGRGSTFSFAIPVTADAPGSIDTAHSHIAADAIAIAPGQGELRALVVDDNADHRLLSGRLLQHAGFVTREAANGLEAIAQFRAWQPQLVVMDMRMPGMDGAEATQQIRRIEGGRKAVIVILTASAFAEERDSMVAAGADDVIVKPFDLGILLDLLKQRLGVSVLRTDTEQKVGDGETAPISLEGLPQATRSRLLRAAIELDRAAIREIAADIAPSDSTVAAWLDATAEDYRFDEIARLLEPDTAAG